MRYDPIVTRTRLVDTARSEFERNGFNQATGQAIWKAAKVSNGSWRHFFRNGKIDIAAAVYPGLHAEIWDAVLEGLGGPPRTPDTRPIKRALEELIKQMTSNRGRAKLFFELQVVLAKPDLDGVVVEREQAARSVVDGWVAATIGAATPSPISDLSFGLIFGPAIDLCRLWAFGQITDIPDNAAKYLAAAAAASLRSSSLPRMPPKMHDKTEETGVRDLLAGVDPPPKPTLR
jgi:AcrR family transcriptional regulator